MDQSIINAIVDLIVEIGSLVVAATALIKVRTATAKGDLAEAKNISLTKELELLKSRIDVEYKSEIAIMKQKLDNDYNSIKKMEAKTEVQGTSLATLNQRVDVVEKLTEKVDRLTEVVISVKTLVEQQQKK